MNRRKVEMIPIDLIDCFRRIRIEYKNIRDLKKSIKENGLLQSLLVFPRADGRYTLLAGGRRYKACKELIAEGEIPKEVPCLVVTEEGLTQAELRLYELEENLQREDLTPEEEFKGMAEYHKLKIQLHGEKKSTSPHAEGWSIRDTAKELGTSPAKVSTYLKIAELYDKIPDLKKAKTKKEAQIIVDRYSKQVKAAAVAAVVEQSQPKTKEESLKKVLIDNYKVGDTMKLLSEVPSETADLVEIDPPYAIELDSVKSLSENVKVEDSYIEWSPEEYRERIPVLINEAYRILKSDGWLIMWFALDPWYQYLRREIEKTKFILNGLPGAWVKTKGQLNAQMTPIAMASAIEYFFYARKGKATVNRQGRLNWFLYSSLNPTKKWHRTQKPIALMQDIYSTFVPEGSRIVIPFLGSGTGLLAAANLKCTAFGFDLSHDSKEGFTKKVWEGKYGDFKD